MIVMFKLYWEPNERKFYIRYTTAGAPYIDA